MRTRSDPPASVVVSAWRKVAAAVDRAFDAVSPTGAGLVGIDNATRGTPELRAARADRDLEVRAQLQDLHEETVRGPAARAHALQTLQLPPDATAADIDLAYRTLSHTVRPSGLGKPHQRIVDIRAAYETLRR